MKPRFILLLFFVKTSLSAQVSLDISPPSALSAKFDFVRVDVPDIPFNVKSPKRAYWISKYEVSQEQWAEVMGTWPSARGHCPTCPVENVSLYQIYAFIAALNIKTGMTYRLPDSGEWEFAARGGLRSKGFRFSGGNFIDALAWYRENSGGQPQPIGKKRPNELGLYDMTGNVWEWVVSLPDQAWKPLDTLAVEWRGGAWNYGYALLGLDKLTQHVHPSLGFPVAGFRLVYSKKDP
jgi:formylglycine-generating enzyme required for sulfatase activity